MYIVYVCVCGKLSLVSLHAIVIVISVKLH